MPSRTAVSQLIVDSASEATATWRFTNFVLYCIEYGLISAVGIKYTNTAASCLTGNKTTTTTV